MTLKASVGSLVLDSEPAGASVLIDGDARGEAPATIESVCAGTHVSSFAAVSAAPSSASRSSREPASRSVAACGPPSRCCRPIRARQPTRAWPSARLRAADRRAVRAAGRSAQGNGHAKRGNGRLVRLGQLRGDAPQRPARPTASSGRRPWRARAGVGAAGATWCQRSPPCPAHAGSTVPDEIAVMLDQPDSVKQALDRLQTPLVLTRGSLRRDGD